MVSSELLETIYLFLEKQIELNVLEEWIISKEVCLLSDKTSSDFNIIGLIELSLAEIQDNILTIDQFREKLLDQVRQISSILYLDNCSPDRSKTTSSNKTVRPIPTPIYLPTTRVIEVQVPA